jgi:hypothetical protein
MSTTIVASWQDRLRPNITTSTYLSYGTYLTLKPYQFDYHRDILVYVMTGGTRRSTSNFGIPQLAQPNKHQSTLILYYSPSQEDVLMRGG